jgi:hypothetical protein
LSVPGAAPARRGLTLVLLLLAAGAVLAAIFAPRLNVDAGWAAAFDKRSWLGIPNAGNVLTNLPFVPAGLLGLLLALRQPAPGPVFRSAPERAGWLLFFAFVLITAFTSTWFHLAPSPDRLLFDRATLIVACQGVFFAVLAERLGVRSLALLVALSLGALAATVWWWWTSRQGAADLRWYGVAQLLPIGGLLLVLAFTRSRDAGLGLWWLVAGYGAAKLAEMLDQPILRSNGLLSGHALKHVLAAGAAFAAFVVLRRRAALSSGRASAPAPSSAPRVPAARAAPPR